MATTYKYKFQLAVTINSKRGRTPTMHAMFRVMVPELGLDSYDSHERRGDKIEPLPEVGTVTAHVVSKMRDLGLTVDEEWVHTPRPGINGGAYINLACSPCIGMSSKAKAVEIAVQLASEVEAICRDTELGFHATPIEFR